MGNVLAVILTLACIQPSSFQPATITQNIERAFLQDNAKLLYSLFPRDGYINISLPEPISFSDQLSNQQAFFLFKKIFSDYSTYQFFPEKQPETKMRVRTIYRAQWSFRDKRNYNHVFDIFFQLIHGPDSGWQIGEIKAEKI